MLRYVSLPVLPMVAISLLIVRCRSCPDGWVQRDQHCYLPMTSPKLTWVDAVAACRRVGGNIALPSTVQEHVWIWTLFVEQNISKESHSLNGGLWLGCSKPTGDDGPMVCWKPSALPKQRDHAKWQHDQPDGGDCVVLWHFDDLWADVRCDRARFTICERPLCERLVDRCYAVELDEQECGSLGNYVIEERQMSSPKQCCAACSKISYCWSFSIKENTCLFYNVKRSDVVGKPVDGTANCVYYDVDKN